MEWDRYASAGKRVVAAGLVRSSSHPRHEIHAGIPLDAKYPRKTKSSGAELPLHRTLDTSRADSSREKSRLETSRCSLDPIPPEARMNRLGLVFSGKPG